MCRSPSVKESKKEKIDVEIKPPFLQSTVVPFQRAKHDKDFRDSKGLKKKCILFTGRKAKVKPTSLFFVGLGFENNEHHTSWQHGGKLSG